MPTILPPPTTPSPAPSPAPTPTVTVPNPPQAVAQLPLGTVLNAEIVNLLARTTAEVETSLGNFQIRTNLALTQGSQLELQLLRLVPQLQLAVRSIDGHPPQGQLRAASNVIIPAAPSGTAAGQSSAHATLAAVSSSLLRPDSGNSASGTLSVGSIIRATVAQTSNPTTAATGPAPSVPTAQSGSSPHGAAVISAATTASQPAAPPAPANVLPAGARIALRIDGITPPVQGQPPSTGAPSGSMTGTVAAIGPSGRPLVETPLGLMSLDTSSKLSVGTRLTLSPVPLLQRTDSPLSVTAGAPETFIQSRQWPHLEEAIAHMAQAGGEGGAQIATSPLPRADSQLATNLLFFLNALRGGDLRGWLGNGAELLERDLPELAARLREDFAQFARTFNEAPQNDWRTAIVPFFHGNHLEPVQMHMRGRSPQGDKDENGGSRFIIDVELSRLGRVQLDGFVKSRNRHFDLIVRTDQPLPVRMRRDINHIFTDFGEASGIRGAITFQAHARFVDVPLPRLVDSANDGLVV